MTVVNKRILVTVSIFMILAVTLFTAATVFCTPNVCPQYRQNLEPSGISLPHFLQIIGFRLQHSHSLQ